MYRLQIFEFITDQPRWESLGTKHKHVGYTKQFETKKDACEFYDENLRNGMRKLNAYGTYKSDWDIHDKLCYSVVEVNDKILDYFVR